MTTIEPMSITQECSNPSHPTVASSSALPTRSSSSKLISLHYLLSLFHFYSMHMHRRDLEFYVFVVYKILHRCMYIFIICTYIITVHVLLLGVHLLRNIIYAPDQRHASPI